MSTTTPTTTKPSGRKTFINLPVRDLPASIAFFTKLGFTFNARFTDENATCMIIGEDSYAMLLVHGRFKDFARRPIGDSTQQTSAIIAISAADRAEVDRLADNAFAAGATAAADVMELGFMYGKSFYDLDGHHWEVFWMDPAAVAGE